ncbi:MAG: YraN family protein [Beijerinckiaceae bacterium]
MRGEDRKRSVANLQGADAERVALVYLMAKGYWPMARRYLSQAGEVDLIMQRGKTVVLVEVKARSTLDAAAMSITPDKIRRLGAALNRFRAERQLDDSYTFRCDLVLVAPWKWPRHVVNAGELG